MKKIFLLTFLLSLFITSCVRLKDTVYLQGDIAKKLEDIEGQFKVEQNDYLVKTNDLLYIRVSSFDEISTAFLNMGASSTGASNALSASLIGHRVGLDGAIDFPFLGKIYVVGLSLSEIERKIEVAAEVYVDKSSVTVKLLNDIITVGRGNRNQLIISVINA